MGLASIGVRRPPLTSLKVIETSIRSAWSLWTCDPVDQLDWSQSNPALGQCASTALTVQDLLGGALRVADVHACDGSSAGVHYWNVLCGGLQLDLTREQFRGGQTIGPGREIARPADLARGRLPGNYRLLSRRVERELDGALEADRRRPVSIKAVCRDETGRVLLCRNHRDEWELPGGRPTRGELFSECVVREVCEETGLIVEVDRLVDAIDLEVQPGRWVDILAYACVVGDSSAGQRPAVSPEHTAVAFRDPSDCPAAELSAAYRTVIAQT